MSIATVTHDPSVAEDGDTSPASLGRKALPPPQLRWGGEKVTHHPFMRSYVATTERPPSSSLSTTK